MKPVFSLVGCRVICLFFLLGLIAAPSLAKASSEAATSGYGNSQSGGHVEIEHVKAKPITLVEKAKLAELDHNRHRKVEVEAVELSTASTHSSLIIVLLVAAVLFVVGVLYMRSGAFINRKLGFKLSVGFGAVILLALAIGGGTSYYMNEINSKYDLALAAADLDMMAGELGGLQNAFVLYGIADKARGETIRKEIVTLLTEFGTDVGKMEEQELEQEEMAALGHVKEAVGNYKKSFAHLADKFHAIEELKEELDQAGEKMSHELETVIHEHEKELEELQERGATGSQVALQTKLVETLFEAEILELKLSHAEVEFLLDKHIDRVATMEAELSELYAVLATAKQIIPMLNTPAAEQQADLAMLADVEANLHHFQEMLSEVIVDELLVESDLIDLTADVEEMEGNGAAFAERMDHEAEATKEDANVASMVLMALALLIGSLVSFFLTRSIVKPVGEAVDMMEELEKGHLGKRVELDRKDEIGHMVRTMNSFADSLQNEIIANLQKLAVGDLTFDITPRDEQDEVRGAIKKLGIDLNEIIGQIQVSGEQIASGSGQVSDTSQSLSQGATEQASSLEEISASLNQMSSQTTTNAENANQANSLSAEAQQAAQDGSRQMQAMVGAMTEINEAGQNISKIIKTIDEIAFQTNLLALNAAVEAARAGQHGKGFAVVAEEVRNLAARSAKAAEETSALIEGSVEKTENGSVIANQTAEALEEIVGGVSKVSDLVAEIAAASNEQAQGIVQISQGVSQIDQVTQQNTAAAEESAAAAEELSSQAEQMRQMLQRFTLRQVQQAQQPISQVPSSVSSDIGWKQMEQAPQSVPAEKSQIALDDKDFGKY